MLIGYAAKIGRDKASTLLDKLCNTLPDARLHHIQHRRYNNAVAAQVRVAEDDIDGYLAPPERCVVLAYYLYVAFVAHRPYRPFDGPPVIPVEHDGHACSCYSAERAISQACQFCAQ